MRWICPQCGSQVSLALDTCPVCARGTWAETPLPAAATPAANRRRAAPAGAPPRESLFLRGLRIGLGFMLVVVTIVLLVVLALLWLSAHPEWRERLEQLGG